ncbi:MAG TPA: flagellar filament capping protein FliD [Bryobacteraceae bacterium]|nr:flagellar filament capping protein FliD [Bryobacteraceae bacterium]
MAGVTPITINGISQYASDFQSILNRSVQIASIPIQQLQNEQSQVQQQMQAASILSIAVSAVASDLGALGNLGSSKSLTANSTDSVVASAQVTGATASASYAITNVTSVASAASESSLQPFADPSSDPVSTTGSMQLTVGANTYAINLDSSSNNLVGLRDAINKLNAGVTAQILTTGNGGYLSVSANNPGATTLQLADDPSGANTQFLTSLNQGANTEFQLNGVGISTPETTINNVVPGMTFTISGKTAPGETVTISLNSNTSAVSSALQKFVSDYNSLVQQIDYQAGTGDALEGDSAIWQLRNSMMRLVGYNVPGGGIRSLSDLGVEFDQTGTASFDPSQINSLSDSQIGSMFSFLGSATSGLGALAQPFSEISAPGNGVLASEVSSWSTQNQRLSASIDAATTRVNLMQLTLSQQLEAADAQVAQLQSQQNLLTSSIQSLNYTTYGAQVLTQHN